MVVPTAALTGSRTAVLDILDNQTHMAIGTGTTTFNESQTTLIAEHLRNAIHSKTKTTASGTYDFQMRIPLGSSTSEVLSEIGVFDAASIGNMLLREVLSSTITPTSSQEVYITVRITIATANG